MLLQIIIHTPSWVWALLALLLVLGLSQVFPRRVSLGRVLLLPLAMTALSLYGTLSAFATIPASWLAWLLVTLPMTAWLATRPAPRAIRYHRAERSFELPGSWLPLALILAIFTIKYAVGVALAVQPVLAQDPFNAYSGACLYGALSAAFLGRAAQLLQLARPFSTPSSRRPSQVWG